MLLRCYHRLLCLLEQPHTVSLEIQVLGRFVEFHEPLIPQLRKVSGEQNQRYLDWIDERMQTHHLRRHLQHLPNLERVVFQKEQEHHLFDLLLQDPFECYST